MQVENENVYLKHLKSINSENLFTQPHTIEIKERLIHIAKKDTKCLAILEPVLQLVLMSSTPSLIGSRLPHGQL